MNSHDLWKERFSLFIGELQKYLRYIFNGHLMFVLIIGLGGLGYYYSEWVKSLDGTFPAALLLSVILALPLTMSPIYTLLKAPDMFFLLPVEEKLKTYFRKALNFSWIFQCYILLMFLAAGMPLFAAVEGGTLSDFLFILLLLAVSKYINLRIKWAVLRYQEKRTHLFDAFIRYCLNGVMLFLAFSTAGYVYPVLVLAVSVALLLYYERAVSGQLLKWEMLIDAEGKRMMKFYRFANLFTDVPKLKERTARRKYLDPLLTLVRYHSSNTYMYLYARTFLRNGDFLGLYIRLLLIGSFVLISLDSIVPQAIGAGFFAYITGIQLISIKNQHENIIWLDLYPLNKDGIDRDVQKLLYGLLVLQIILFGTIAGITAGLASFAAAIAAGLAAILLIRSAYIKMMKKDAAKWD